MGPRVKQYVLRVVDVRSGAALETIPASKGVLKPLFDWWKKQGNMKANIREETGV